MTSRDSKLGTRMNKVVQINFNRCNEAHDVLEQTLLATINEPNRSRAQSISWVVDECS